MTYEGACSERGAPRNDCRRRGSLNGVVDACESRQRMVIYSPMMQRSVGHCGDLHKGELLRSRHNSGDGEVRAMSLLNRVPTCQLSQRRIPESCSKNYDCCYLRPDILLTPLRLARGTDPAVEPGGRTRTLLIGYLSENNPVARDWKEEFGSRKSWHGMAWIYSVVWSSDTLIIIRHPVLSVQLYLKKCKAFHLLMATW